MAYGRQTRVKICQLEAPQVLATFIRTGLVILTPAWELMTQGTKAATKIMKAFATNPTPSHKMLSGIQAMGGTGLISSKSGCATASIPRYHPMHNPRGVPMPIADTNPIRAKTRLVMKCSCSVAPSGVVSTNFVINVWITTIGGASSLLWTMPLETKNCHPNRKVLMLAKDKTVLRFSHGCAGFAASG
jgi:hypothetical protein